MSGTSLDGLDLAYCVFRNTKKGWSYSIEKSETIKYSKSWRQQLSGAHTLAGEALIALDVAYGKYLGEQVSTFVEHHKLRVDFVASHGHTIFHQPKRGFTYQLGNGNALYAACKIPVVADFRTLDVMLGGEGAPLVPAGDKVLFGAFDICLNLGGIANLSMNVSNKRIAYDICFCNMGLNYLMEQLGKSFDNDGRLASTGQVHAGMLKQLATAYKGLNNARQSLGRELFEKKIKPIIDQKNISIADKLNTLVESAAKEMATAFSGKKNPTVLCTGGGTFNSFLISRLLEHCGDDATLVIPEEEVVKFKEAMVFAFLGVLRVRNEKNCLASVTGARRDSSSGVMIGF